ncbi:MAG: transcriptional regulator [Myxococcales bacterium]|jgi:predicted Zn-ribbon and HTH transcriptional regulator
MPRAKKPLEAKGPPERESTVRAALRRELERGPLTARELSSGVGIRERDVAGHLEHLSRSLEARGDKLVIQPASCLECGYLFRERKRFTTPGRCPRCGSERIEPPAFSVEKG